MSISCDHCSQCDLDLMSISLLFAIRQHPANIHSQLAFDSASVLFDFDFDCDVSAFQVVAVVCLYSGATHHGVGAIRPDSGTRHHEFGVIHLT